MVGVIWPEFAAVHSTLSPLRRFFYLLPGWHAVGAATKRGQATLPNAARKFIAANNRSAPPRLLQLHLLSTPAPRHSYIAAFPLGRCRMWVSWTRNLFFLFFLLFSHALMDVAGRGHTSRPAVPEWFLFFSFVVLSHLCPRCYGNGAHARAMLRSERSAQQTASNGQQESKRPLGHN